MRNTRHAAVAVFTILVTAVASTSAYATGQASAVEDLSAALEQIAPDLGDVIAPTAVSGGALEAELDNGAIVTIPEGANGTVTLDQEGHPSLSVTLPDRVEAQDAVVTDDGTVVYAAGASDASLAVASLSDGQVSVQTVIPTADSAHAFTYTVGDGVQPILREDGGVDLVVAADGGARVVVGEFAAPWAYGADGAEVATAYVVSGQEVTQTVTPTAATVYPIVADPTYGHSYGIPTIYLNRAETRGAAGDVGTVRVMCAGVGFFSKYLGLMCIANVQVIHNGAKRANNAGECVKILVGPMVTSAVSYSANCR